MTDNPTQASKKYRAYRLKVTEPSFSLAKIKALIKTLKVDSDDNLKLSDQKFASLTTKEKFTYTMIHGEDYSQICDVMPGIVDEEKLVFAYPMGPFDTERSWSERQRKFLVENRKDVTVLLRSTIKSKNRMGMNLKQAAIESNAIDLIPDMISLYKKERKDHDILSVLMILMKENKYSEFIATPMYSKLYSDEASFLASLGANRENQDLIMQRALDFYKSKTKK